MRRLFSGLIGGAALMLAGSAANATPYTGTLFLALGTLPPVSLGGSGSAAVGSISANTFLGSGSSPVTGVAPLTQIFLSLTGNAAGVVGNGPFLSGTLQARGFGFAIPLVNAPLGGELGFVGGALPPDHTGGSATQSAVFGGWATGVVTIARTHPVLTAACVASANSTNCPTAMLGGATANSLHFGGAAQIVLVTPVDLYTNNGGIGGIPSFTIMALNYVPEPASVLLLGSGVFALLMMGKRRSN